MESIPLERRAATLDLVMLIIETTGSLSASIRFNSDLFDAATIARMAEHFHTLLESVLRDPSTAIDDLEILTDAERQQLLYEFNDTKSDYPKDTCIHSLFERQVERTPDNVAVEFEGQQLTYAQLNARANQLAHHLQALGVKPEVPVAICMERCPEMIIGLLGILKAGGAYVPIDPAYPKERLAFVMNDVGATVVLTQERVRASLPEHGIHALCLDTCWDAIAQESEANPEHGSDRHQPRLHTLHLGLNGPTQGRDGRAPRGYATQSIGSFKRWGFQAKTACLSEDSDHASMRQDGKSFRLC